MFKKLCLLLMLALTLGACSGATPAASDASSDDPTSEPTGSEHGDTAAFCASGEATFGAGNPFQGFDIESPETLRAGFETAVAAFTELYNLAPADVRVTIEGGVAAMAEIEASLDAVDYDFSRLTSADRQRFMQLASAFDFDAFAQAAAKHCG